MKYDAVYEGGGAKGVAFAGSLRACEQRGLEAGTIVGVSAGAITVGLVGAGYKSDELYDMAFEKTDDGKPVMASFMDTPTLENVSEEVLRKSITWDLFDAVSLPFPVSLFERTIDRKLYEAAKKSRRYRRAFSLLELGGAYGGDVFREWLATKIEAKGRGLGNATLEGFYRATGVDVTFVVTDTGTDEDEGCAAEMLALNHRTAPQCPVVWAIRMSMCVPAVWQEVVWQSSWGSYMGRDITGHFMDDGGLASNFPVGLLTGRAVDTIAARMGPETTNPVIGFLIDEMAGVPAAPPKPDDGGRHEGARHFALVRRANRWVNAMLTARDNLSIEAHQHLICRLPAKGYGMLEFEMSDARVKAIVDAAAEATGAHLDGRGMGLVA